MKTYSNDNNLLCVEEDGKKNFHELSFLLRQKDKVEQLKIEQQNATYEGIEDMTIEDDAERQIAKGQSAIDLKNQIISLRDSELSTINELITQANNLKIT